jgi:hypothetical protein
MKRQKLVSLVLAATLGGALGASSVGAAELVKNGSLTQMNASGFLFAQNNDAPPEWQKDTGTVDVNMVGYNAGLPVQFSPFPRYGVEGVEASPDGGTWVGIAHNPDPDPTRFNDERFKQSISGFVVGQTYLISWYAANFGTDLPGTSNDYLAGNGVQVFMDGSRLGSGATLEVSNAWVAEQTLFTATSNLHVLMFGTKDAARSYISIDGISVTAVPEPSAWAMWVAGLLGLVGWSSSRSVRKA